MDSFSLIQKLLSTVRQLKSCNNNNEDVHEKMNETKRIHENPEFRFVRPGQVKGLSHIQVLNSGHLRNLKALFFL